MSVPEQDQGIREPGLDPQGGKWRDPCQMRTGQGIDGDRAQLQDLGPGPGPCLNNSADPSPGPKANMQEGLLSLSHRHGLPPFKYLLFLGRKYHGN